MAAAASMISKDTVEKAVAALLKWRESQSENKKPQLIPQDEFIYLNITLKKIPQRARTNPFRVSLPHPLHDPSSELCLIIDDRPNSSLTSDDAKKIIKAQQIPVSKVIKLSKLKSDYKPFEAKRKLCDSYDLFFVDKRVVHFLPRLIGKQFFKKKKLPLPVDLTHKNWKEQIERACGCGLLFLSTGTCSVMKVAKASMENEEIVENVMGAINGAVEMVPKKWDGVRSLHLKISGSLALPLYQVLPDMKLKIEGIKQKKVEVEEASGSEAEMNKREFSKLRKKKGRIHEVQYMDVGIGEDELSEDENNENQELETQTNEGDNTVSEEQEIQTIEDEKSMEKKGKRSLEKIHRLSELSSSKRVKKVISKEDTDNSDENDGNDNEDGLAVANNQAVGKRNRKSLKGQVLSESNGKKGERMALQEGDEEFSAQKRGSVGHDGQKKKKASKLGVISGGGSLKVKDKSSKKKK